jgi:GxxExxY protein
LPRRHRDTETSDLELNEITEKIIGCAIEVHRHLGPGLLEHAYEEALCIEFQLQGLDYQRQVAAPLTYKGRAIGEYRIDLLVEDAVVVEIKSVERYDPVFEAQVLTYLRMTGKRVGLLMNFNSRLLKNGIKRFVL